MKRIAFVLGLAATVATARAAPTERLCEPRWPQFCANVHVTCAEHTRLPARAFIVRVDDDGVRVSAVGSEVDEVLGRYANPRIERDDASGSTMLRPAQGPGYLLLEADGRYSMRHYLGATGVMSIGTCR